MSIGIALSIINGPEEMKYKKETSIAHIDELISKISKMTILEYLNYMNEKET
jgi:hypothetical protein